MSREGVRAPDCALRTAAALVAQVVTLPVVEHVRQREEEGDEEEEGELEVEAQVERDRDGAAVPIR